MIQSVERAAAILGALGSGTPRLGVTEIAEQVGLAKPTVYGLLRTLEKHDLVVQDPDSGKYSLGPGVLQLGNAYLDGSELRARSLLWAEALAQRAAMMTGDRVPLTGRTKTARAALSRALAQVRKQGYAVEDQEATVGDAGIAAPVLGRDGVVAGAIGVVGAADRLLATPARDELVRAVQEAARAISRDLGAARGGGPALSALS